MSSPRVTALAVLGCIVAAAGIARGQEDPSAPEGFSCYPENEFVMKANTGPTNAYGAGKGSFADGQIALPPNPSIQGEGGNIQWAFRAGIVGDNSGASDGFMLGGLIVKITWNDDRPDTIFKSGCVQEIQTSRGSSGETEFLAEFEGIVENFPGVDGSKAAVGTLTITGDRSKHSKGRFALELGATCEYFLIAGRETELTLSFGGNVSSLHIDNVTAGRWAFPSGKIPSDCPLEFEIGK